MKQLIYALLLAPLCVPQARAEIVLHFPMELEQGQVSETVSGDRFEVQGHFAPEQVIGAEGGALRLDGYSSVVEAHVGTILPEGSRTMTFALRVALESYPIIHIDQNTTEQTAIAGCLDESSKSGFGFTVGIDGRWSFKGYVGGWPLEVAIDTPLPLGTWNNLVATVDCAARRVTVYNNGSVMGTARCSGTMKYDSGEFVIGRSLTPITEGQFVLNAINGAVDEIEVWDEVLSDESINAWSVQGTADLSIPASRYADDLLRPRFHGMPATAWTNESHGMIYADGRYHLFFQKNANGPYMARLHWGHLSSANLYDWQEEPIALTPGESYDMKGCWSGCVFSDPIVTEGRPNIVYTAVDYARAVIAVATPEDEALSHWNKAASNPMIDGRPDGLSDDFRDPYFFRDGENAYLIVGSSKQGVGTTTLHRYNATSGTWSNDGTLFFSGNNAAQDGTFWEMPNITPMDNGRWLFTATPQNTASGVHTMYWCGSIQEEGTFAPTTIAGSNVELCSRDGYGLLSPTIYQHEGKTLALGIVPDKLSSELNYTLGWAHCYSLPREWSLNDRGTLEQKPYSGLVEMRSDVAYERRNFTLNGSEALAPAQGREVELCGLFTIGREPFGFKFFKNDNGEATLTYEPTTGVVSVDFTHLNRWSNDAGIYDGLYCCSLPEVPAIGSELKIQLFVDHAIIDLFVNDRWATSIRVFPTDADAEGVEAFAEGATQVRELHAWNLNPKGTSGLQEVVADEDWGSADVRVYDLYGHLLSRQPSREEALRALAPGLYIVTDGRNTQRICKKSE